MIGEARCSTCVFLQPSDATARPRSGGQCRRHAPHVFTGDDNRPRAIWPLVWADSWCGDHATHREEATEE